MAAGRQLSAPTLQPAGALIKKLRLDRGMTLADLARTTGKTKGYLSKLERADKLPPFTTLSTLAQALGVDLDALLSGGAATAIDNTIAAKGLSAAPSARRPLKKDAPASHRNLDLHRGGAAQFVAGEAYMYLPLVQQYRGKYMSPFLMKLPPGKSRTFTHDAEEFTYVLSGRVDLIYESKRYKLTVGDGFYLDSRIEHTFFNPGKHEVLMLSVSYNYRRF